MAAAHLRRPDRPVRELARTLTLPPLVERDASCVASRLAPLRAKRKTLPNTGRRERMQRIRLTPFQTKAVRRSLGETKKGPVVVNTPPRTAVPVDRRLSLT